jgi:hypothetical protein
MSVTKRKTPASSRMTPAEIRARARICKLCRTRTVAANGVELAINDGVFICWPCAKAIDRAVLRAEATICETCG